MRPGFLIILAALFACFIGSYAVAGVTILNDGADGQSAKIRIAWAIKKGDLAAFEAALSSVSQTATRINDTPFITVELDSPGGDVVEAIGIGRAIYRRSAMTLVRPGQECVSACVFILMAGAVHSPVDGARIGVHRPLLLSWRNMDYSAARAKYDGLMRYLHGYFLELGVSEAAYDTMMRTDSYDMRYFTPAELDRFKLRGEGPGWRMRFAVAQAQSVAAITAQPLPAAEAPSLPKIDESYRYIVFMPGDLPPGKDYLAGIDVLTTPFSWESLDDDGPQLRWDGSDIPAMAEQLLRILGDLLAQGWWLILVLAVELVRGSHSTWPDHPSLRNRDQWRLKPFRPYEISPASIPASAPAWPGPAGYGGSGS